MSKRRTHETQRVCGISQLSSPASITRHFRRNRAEKRACDGCLARSRRRSVTLEYALTLLSIPCVLFIGDRLQIEESEGKDDVKSLAYYWECSQSWPRCKSPSQVKTIKPPLGNCSR